jgi:hypothetical protein
MQRGLVSSHWAQQIQYLHIPIFYNADTNKLGLPSKTFVAFERQHLLSSSQFLLS